MFIIFGTLIVRALRPLAKDHVELVSVEPEESQKQTARGRSRPGLNFGGMLAELSAEGCRA